MPFFMGLHVKLQTHYVLVFKIFRMHEHNLCKDNIYNKGSAFYTNMGRKKLPNTGNILFCWIGLTNLLLNHLVVFNNLHPNFIVDEA